MESTHERTVRKNVESAFAAMQAGVVLAPLPDGGSEGRNAEPTERSVTYDATYPNGITVKTVVTAEWAQDMLSFEYGHPKFGYAGSFHEKRPPSAIELALLDILAPQ